MHNYVVQTVVGNSFWEETWKRTRYINDFREEGWKI